MAAQARLLGLKVMVGNMERTSLAMAPGFVLGQLCVLATPVSFASHWRGFALRLTCYRRNAHAFDNLMRRQAQLASEKLIVRSSSVDDS